MGGLHQCKSSTSAGSPHRAGERFAKSSKRGLELQDLGPGCGVYFSDRRSWTAFSWTIVTVAEEEGMASRNLSWISRATSWHDPILFFTLVICSA